MATTDTAPTATLDASQVERLVAFVYLLTRGTPSFAGVPWGSVKGVVRELAEIEGEHSFCSPAGEALAREIVQELLTGERPAQALDIDRTREHLVLANFPSITCECDDPSVWRSILFDCGARVLLFKAGYADLFAGAQQDRDAIGAVLRASGWALQVPL